MAIEVVSNEPKVETPAAKAPEVKPEVQEEKTKQSAPEAKASEQKESGESGTSETEVKETTSVEQEESGSDEDAGEPSEPEAKEKPKKPGGFQRKVNKLVREKEELRQRIGVLESLVARNGQSTHQETKTDPKPVAAADGEPQPEDFDTHAKYVKAIARWEAEQVHKENSQKAEKSRLETEHQVAQKTFFDRQLAFNEKTEDYQEVVANLSDIPRNATIERLLMSNEKGPELLYEFGKHKDEARRIAALPPLEAAREFGKFEFQFLRASEPKPQEQKKVSKAPDPITPVGGGGKATVVKSLEELAKTDIREFKRVRNEEELKKRRRA